MTNDSNYKNKKNFYNPKSCPGCGKLNALIDDHNLCQRCFRILNYNDFSKSTTIIKPELLVSSLDKTIKNYFIVIDIFNFKIKDINLLLSKINPQLNKILIINKIDLLEKSAKIHNILNRIREQFKNINNLKLLPVCALANSKHMATLLNFIINSNNKSVFIGMENAGKSTIIKYLLNQKNIKNNLISSRFPGTTINLVKFKINDLEIIDTPGIKDTNSLRSFSKDPFHKWWSFKNNIKAQIFQLNSGQSLFFGNLIRLNFISGIKSSFTIYTNHHIKIFRTKTINVPRVLKRSQEILKWPLKKDNISQINYTQTLTLKNNLKKIDLEISDIGIISLISKGQIITINSNLKNPVKIRDSLF